MKLRGYFNILSLLLLILFGITLYETLQSFSWKGIAVEVLILITLGYLVFFYGKTVRPLQNISNGMDLLKEQDFSSRLREVGQYEADKVVDIFNKMMNRLKEERLRLREQNEFLDLLINASPMGVVILNFDKEISVINPAAARILGIAAVGEVTGKNMTDIKEFVRLDLSEIPLRETRALSLSDGSVYKCTHESFVDRGFPRPFYLIESLTDELRLAEKKAYEKVIRMIAHEVNNTTAGITSTLDTIEQDLSQYEDAGDMQEAMKVCIDRCFNMSKFITNFADVVRIPEVQLAPVNLNDLVQSMMRFMEVMCLHRNINLHFEPDENFKPVLLDASLFEQVLQNIIKNSVESIDTDGEIHITISSQNQSITITDNGKGISREVEQKLFRPFFSTKPTGQGIGLLFIREVLIQHNCQFSLRTHPDGLTRFEITF